MTVMSWEEYAVKHKRLILALHYYGWQPSPHFFQGQLWRCFYLHTTTRRFSLYLERHKSPSVYLVNWKRGPTTYTESKALRILKEINRVYGGNINATATQE